MYNQYRPYGFGGLPIVVKNLLLVNVLVFVFSVLMQESHPEINNLLIVHYFQSVDFRPHQLVTAMFMHAGFGHLLGNMIGLWVFGSMLENVWGQKRFLIFYMACGLGANLCDQLYLATKYIPQINQLEALLINPNLSDFENESVRQAIISIKEGYASLGASGAVYGLIMGAAMLFPNTMIYLYFMIPVKLKYLAIFYGLIELTSAMSRMPGDNVAHLVHLGGMLIGFILIMIWKKKRDEFY